MFLFYINHLMCAVISITYLSRNNLSFICSRQHDQQHTQNHSSTDLQVLTHKRTSIFYLKNIANSIWINLKYIISLIPIHESLYRIKSLYKLYYTKLHSSFYKYHPCTIWISSFHKAMNDSITTHCRHDTLQKAIIEITPYRMELWHSKSDYLAWLEHEISAATFSLQNLFLKRYSSFWNSDKNTPSKEKLVIKLPNQYIVL